MKKLIIFLFVSLFFCCNESSKNISEYELIENWAKIPDDYTLGNPTGVALTSNQNLVVFHRGSRSWQVPMPKEKIIEDTFIEIHNKLRPGEPATVKAGQQLIYSRFFDPKRYDLGRVGRYKINKS